MFPILTSSASKCLTRYKQILSGCSLGCKNSLNFTRLPMKFHNRGHTTAHFQTFFIFPDIGIPNTMPILICSSIWICVQCRWSIPKKVDRWRKKVNWIESARTLWCVLKKKKTVEASTLYITQSGKSRLNTHRSKIEKEKKSLHKYFNLHVSHVADGLP